MSGTRASKKIRKNPSPCVSFRLRLSFRVANKMPKKQECALFRDANEMRDEVCLKLKTCAPRIVKCLRPSVTGVRSIGFVLRAQGFTFSLGKTISNPLDRNTTQAKNEFSLFYNRREKYTRSSVLQTILGNHKLIFSVIA